MVVARYPCQAFYQLNGLHPPGGRMPNHLARATSPYLLQHAENPVDWYPWGPEALNRAKAEEKPIFLSIGYAACHWCHVMAHESFENPQIAALLSRSFISIKVDREERPDLDALYMEAVVAMTGGGGWPMSVFLTPDGKPFFGGTYFPPSRRSGLPGFADLLEEIARRWQNDREELLQAGTDLTRRMAVPAFQFPSESAFNPDLIQAALDSMLRGYDWKHGGWGPAPKFPQAGAIDWLLFRHASTGDPLALDLAFHNLDRMAGSGIHDHIGGGFHRYAVDQDWRVPHFEKMLYDNALLARAYLHAWQIGRQERHRQVLDMTLQFLRTEMHDAGGGFYASLDADSDGAEGLFYTWTREELEQTLGGALGDQIADYYGVQTPGPVEGRSVLHLAGGYKQAGDRALGPAEISKAQGLLMESRRHRSRPALDDKIVAAWNGLLLQTLAETAAATGDPAILEIAQQLAAFVLDQMTVNGRLHRTWRGGTLGPEGFLEDYAAVGLGLLALYQADFHNRWFQAASQFAGQIVKRFGDPAGGFFDTPIEQRDLLARPKSIRDSPTPGGNSMAATLFLQLDALDSRPELRGHAENTVSCMQQITSRHPTAFSQWLFASSLLAKPIPQLALVGNPATPDFQALAGVARQKFRPALVIAAGAPEQSNAPRLLEGRQPIDGRPAAYLCLEFTCRLPATTADQLEQQLADVA
jgi:uncharacterized protein YyaL (SSP411 family)